MTTNQNNNPTSPWVTVPVNTSNIFIPGGLYYFPVPTEEVATDSEKIKDDRDGCVCKSCREFFQFTEPNQTDKSFICYGCRHGY